MSSSLELSQSMIDDPALSKYTREYVIGAMLYSHTPDVWDEYMKTALSNHLMQTVGVVPSARRMLDEEMGEALWKLRGEAMPTRYWAEGNKFRPSCESGFFAGWVYCMAIEQYMATREFSIEDLKREAEEWARAARIKLRHAKLEAAMKKHRRVAHLWASHVHAALRGGIQFPYEPDGIHDFLFRARWYQEWGLRICPAGNPPLFPDKEILRIPDKLKLKTGLLGFGDADYHYPLASSYPPEDGLPPLLTVERR